MKKTGELFFTIEDNEISVKEHFRNIFLAAINFKTFRQEIFFGKFYAMLQWSVNTTSMDLIG